MHAGRGPSLEPSFIALHRFPPHLIPCMQDVAGLVPGAYQGRGRGNAFLNDLTDADVLIHVVDASGRTDREGQLLPSGEGADPLEDVGWVRQVRGGSERGSGRVGEMMSE
jgi:hypothetical protein